MEELLREENGCRTIKITKKVGKVNNDFAYTTNIDNPNCYMKDNNGIEYEEAYDLMYDKNNKEIWQNREYYSTDIPIESKEFIDG